MYTYIDRRINERDNRERERSIYDVKKNINIIQILRESDNGMDMIGR